MYDRNVLELLDSFRLNRPAALERLRVVNSAVSPWDQEALALGAAADETASTRKAFEGANRERVQNLKDAGTSIIIALKKKGGGPPKPASHGGERVWIDAHYRGGRLVPGHFRSKPDRG